MSPFRYPGGKAFLTGYLASKLADLGPGEIHYCEPFCGGAGAALNLLDEGRVTFIHLNDADARVYSAWHAIIHETDRFLDRLNRASVSIDEWHEARELISGAGSDAKYSFELGFAAWFINRTARGGILLGSGPIGGYKQGGTWKINARFYRESMARRIQWLGERRDKITLTNEDALSFLKNVAKNLPVERTLIFVDPPYVEAGSRLYLDAMSTAKHADLANLLNTNLIPHWVLTYDDNYLIHQLYHNHRRRHIQVTYSLRESRVAKEILIEPSQAEELNRTDNALLDAS